MGVRVRETPICPCTRFISCLEGLSSTLGTEYWGSAEFCPSGTPKVAAAPRQNTQPHSTTSLFRYLCSLLLSGGDMAALPQGIRHTGDIEASKYHQQQRFSTLQQPPTYHQALCAITKALHPFDDSTGEWQLWQAIEHPLMVPLRELEQLT